MKWKLLLKLVPIAVLAIGGTVYAASQWQASQAKRLEIKPAPGELQSNPTSELAEQVAVQAGDTLTAVVGQRKLNVGLCGVTAPNLDQPLGQESRDYLRQLIPANQSVTLYWSGTDRGGHKLAEVFVKAPTQAQPEQEKILNYEMVRAGMAYRDAKAADHCPNGRILANAENLAKSQQLGAWSKLQAVKAGVDRPSKR